MINSPPGKPASHARRRIVGGHGSNNPNYVQILNSFEGAGVVHRRDALHLVEEGRAEWITKGQIRLTNHPTNTAARWAARNASAPGYDRVRNGFELKPGISGCATVMKFTRGPVHR